MFLSKDQRTATAYLGKASIIGARHDEEKCHELGAARGLPVQIEIEQYIIIVYGNLQLGFCIYIIIDN